MTTGEKVVDFQKQLVVPLSDMATKKIQYDTGEEKIRVEVSFDQPFALNRNVTMENMTQIDAQVNQYQKYIDEKPSLNDEQKKYIMDKVRKEKYKDVIDINFVDKIIKEMDTEIKLGGDGE